MQYGDCYIVGVGVVVDVFQLFIGINYVFNIILVRIIMFYVVYLKIGNFFDNWLVLFV